ncbi:hypothetical protein AVEN_187655-1 [Araneus ventricosus]|uniref:Uncharacterized protein n=1 Tax=Araneus ventricosus TaxID=182803 RepID=A0A4Y2U033_ARAVE|nr:hypothetical protein AVEN_187655-1 [Araneus ventricosus]
MWNSTAMKNRRARGTLIPARREGVDKPVSVETAGSGKHPFSPSSGFSDGSWAPTVHKLLLPQQAFFVDYGAQFLCLSTVQQQFHVW